MFVLDMQSYRLEPDHKASESVRCATHEPIILMKRYLDGKPELTSDEREILLFALYLESAIHKGIASAAIDDLSKH